ncbi:DUF559 domain-containing protein [Gordoniibacillus kamchatkensis]|uniref:DUF559 domain-containing protein n=1 Tax=Gordoniibacillus kamchatkensis TaxID=1590651 RepID=UPI00373AE449
MFCSDECRLFTLNESNRERRIPRTGNCEICGSSFRQKRATQKWCSRECMWKDASYVDRRSKSLAKLAEDKSSTCLEKWLYEALEECQLNFRKYVAIGAFIAVALLIDFNIIIEVDGAYWHRKHASKDGLRDMILAKKGFTTVRFSDEILKSKKLAIPILCDSINEIIRLQLSGGHPPSGSPYRVFWSSERFRRNFD